MIKSYKIKLHPTKEQETLMWQSAGTARWAYNFALAKQIEHYKETGKKLKETDIRKEITQLKKTEEYSWLNNISAQIPKQAVKDLDKAYTNFFKFQKITKEKYTKKTVEKAMRKGRKLTTIDLNGHPKYKSKRKSKPSFFQREDKLKYKDSKVVLEKIGWVKTAEPLPIGKYYNPRISHDGLNWYLTVGIELENPILHKETTEPVGIDLGVKDLATISTGEVVKNINKTKEVRRLNKKLKRLQRQASRHYEKLKSLNKNRKRGEIRYEKSSNLLKLEKEILKIHKRLNNIRTNHLHQTTSKLVKAKPEYIVIEDLNIAGMMKNKHLARAVQEQKLYEFKRQLEYKCEWYSVRLIIADRFYPSSKTCSNCGHIKKDLKLSDRTYKCDCGLSINRDLNASINLREYGKLAS